MTMILKVPGASPEELARGLAAAQAVLDAAGVTDVEAVRAFLELDFWDISSSKEFRKLTPKEIASATALGDARAAALRACCAGWPKVPTIHEWSLDVIIPGT
ncbi:hypothetical protein LJR084_001241 [Variovorax sp. LjRoot84]|uniref:hypothetical protein n=1 Tax=Variovorax sp. LjRoot84 TaxID=3342340 RepID=UPI003ED0B41A